MEKRVGRRIAPALHKLCYALKLSLEERWGCAAARVAPTTKRDKGKSRATAPEEKGCAMEHGKPRAMHAGRATRYEERHIARGHAKRYRPSWSDAAAEQVTAAMEEICSHDGQGRGQLSALVLTKVLVDVHRTEQLISRVRRLSPSERTEAHNMVLALHEEAKALEEAGDHDGAVSSVQGFLRPLRKRRALRMCATALIVPPAEHGPTSLVSWLSSSPEEERLRSIEKNERILTGLRKWPLGWLDRPGVVVYERAAGRISSERPRCGGIPDEQFTRGLVKTDVLPTALANPADHYVVLAPGRMPRWATVQEVARGFLVPCESPLMTMLSREWPLSPAEAVECLGRSVHVGVARRIVRMLLMRGSICPGLVYGSAYSGIDTFAAAIDAETNGDWRYEFASECDGKARAGLLAAWGCCGLTVENCEMDARSLEATTKPTVGLWVCTATCEKYSKRNHSRTSESQNKSLIDIWKALEYVRLRAPRVVVMENVTEVSGTGPITGLLSRLEGYTMEKGELDPRTTALAPMARERSFWVLTRKEVHASDGHASGSSIGPYGPFAERSPPLAD